MRVRVLFQPGEDDEMPTIVDACDEYTEDAWGGTPEFYAQSLTKYPEAREMVVIIPDHAVIDLFKVPTVSAQIDGSVCTEKPQS